MAAISLPATVLLMELTERGLDVRAHGDRIRFRPRKAMTPELAERVRAHKPALLAALSAIAVVPDQYEAFQERAGIMEYDGGSSRSRAEALALAEVTTRMRTTKSERRG